VSEPKKPCEHLNFRANVEVNRLEKGEGGPVYRYQADIRITCDECGLPFRFIGLPAGMDLNGAAVSIDGLEGRFAIAPKGEVLTPLESTDIQGFTVRRTS
jgi:hypothetical protein